MHAYSALLMKTQATDYEQTKPFNRILSHTHSLTRTLFLDPLRLSSARASSNMAHLVSVILVCRPSRGRDMLRL